MHCYFSRFCEYPGLKSKERRSQTSDSEDQKEFQITTDESDQWSPAVYGDIIVWTDLRQGNLDIYGYNLATQEEFQITTDANGQASPAIYGDIAVWLTRADDS